MTQLVKPLVLIGLIMLLSAHRSPAPIREIQESPAPSPKPRHVSRKAPHEQPAATSTPEKKTVSFAGNWKGTASGPSKQALIGTVTLTSNYNLQVSQDEKQVSWTSSAWMFAHFQAPVQKSGRTLSWTYERHDIAGQSNIAVKMEMNPDGTATLMEYTGMTNGAFKGYSYQLIGRLIRQ
jgi:hypothetical protein